MKNSFLSILTAVFAVLALCACQRNIPEVINAPAYDTPIGSDIDIVPEAVKNADKNEKASYKPKHFSPEYLVSSTYSNLVILNADGSVNQTLDISDLPGHFLSYDNGRIFFENFEFEDHLIYAYSVKDINTGEISVLAESDIPKSIDITDDSVIITDEFPVDYIYTETAYDLETLEPTRTSEYSFGKNTLVTYSEKRYREKKSIETLNKECKYILLQKPDQAYVILADGVETTIPLSDRVPLIHAYNSEGIFYSGHGNSQDNTTGSINFYSIKTGENITEPMYSYYEFICADNSSAYYAVSKGGAYNLETYEILRFDFQKMSSESVVTLSKEPGLASIFPLAFTDACSDEGQFYYLDYKEGVADWYVYSAGKNTRLNANVYTDPRYQLGKIEAESRTATCPDCNEKVMQYYGEYFVFNDDCFDAATKVNEYFKDRVETVAEEFITDPVFLSEDATCEEHLQNQCHQYMDENVSDTFFISSDLISLNTDSYLYSGGAHGMPGRDHYLIDAKTGDFLSFVDIYKGTEENFKTIVAQKTVENFASYSSRENPYFEAASENGEEAVYNQAYEEASPLLSQIRFEKDGIVVEYPPCDMGPYSSGFIEIFISYEELDIDIADSNP